MAAREVIGDELHVGAWIYYAPQMRAGEDGMTVIARVINSADAEFYELGLDAEGNPFERTNRGDGEREPKWNKLSLDAFIEGLEEFRLAVKGTELEKWNAAYDDAVKSASAAYARTMSSRFASYDPVVKRYALYDLFREGAGPRMVDEKVRLEKYAFIKRKSGSVEVELQVGWPAGTHYDGAGRCFKIEEGWLGLSWDGFLDRLFENYPANMYSFERYELEGDEGLKAFLGFAK